jgi:hypothetical protein
MSDQLTPEAILRLGFGFWGEPSTAGAGCNVVPAHVRPAPSLTRTASVVVPSGSRHGHC